MMNVIRNNRVKSKAPNGRPCTKKGTKKGTKKEAFLAEVSKLSGQTNKNFLGENICTVAWRLG